MDKQLLKAVKAFNRIMNVIEDLNVLNISEDGQLSTHDGEFKPNTINELVKESEYQLSCFYEGGHTLNDMYYENNKEWHRRVGMLKRFINRYKN